MQHSEAEFEESADSSPTRTSRSRPDGAGSPLSLCSQCQSSSLVDLSHVDLSQQQSLSLIVDGL